MRLSIFKMTIPAALLILADGYLMVGVYQALQAYLSSGVSAGKVLGESNLKQFEAGLLLMMHLCLLVVCLVLTVILGARFKKMLFGVKRNKYTRSFWGRQSEDPPQDLD